MLQAILNIWKITELRTKILFTLGMLAVYRIGFWIPLPGVDQEVLSDFFKQATDNQTAAGKLIQYMQVFSGGSLSHSTIFGLGIMPYITASIIFQLVASVSPQLKKLQQEGPTGRQRIQEWTRQATVALCIIQAVSWLKYITASGLVYSQWASNPVWWVMAVTALTAGTMFLMWLGEQIDKYGIGNGVSLIIMGGILADMPNAIGWIAQNSPIREYPIVRKIFGVEDGWQPSVGYAGLLAILGGFVLVVGGSVLMTVAQRRIPIQQAKHTRGRKVFGGQKSYLPLRINHGGVMPIIFASSLMIFPSFLFSMLHQYIATTRQDGFGFNLTSWLQDAFQPGQFPYILIYVIMVYFFSYFWITVQFNPDEMAKQLRDHGSFILGLRPGPRTSEYLEAVMVRITFVGAAFLSLIAVIPMVVNRVLHVSPSVSHFLGGTGLLIVVSVALDFVQRVEANLLMRNYAGFLGGNEDGSGARIRGPRTY